MDELVFQKVLYNDINSRPGVYVIEVRNGKKYVGQSKDIRRRVRVHMQEIFNNRNSYKQYFYKRVHDIITENGYTRDDIDELFTFWQHLTSTAKEAEEKEAWYLEQIALNGDKKEYYNSWYGSQNDLNNKKKKEFIQEKIKENKMRKEKENEERKRYLFSNNIVF